MNHIKFQAEEKDKNQRIDKFLSDKISKTNQNISRTRIKNLIEESAILINEKICQDASYKIKGDEVIEINIPDPKPTNLIPKKIPFEVIFEDEFMMVINKPHGLTTHPGNGNHQETLANALLEYCGDNLSGINGVLRPGIVHRLDKDTSGLMVVAKNDLAHQSLAKQIQERTLKRNYLALCSKVPKPLKGKIKKNIDRSRINRLKMTIVQNGGKEAITNYEVKEIFQNGLFSLVECKLETGRTHQIRVHMASIGHAIIGDQLYGNRGKFSKDLPENIKNALEGLKRQALHSYKISFFHPKTSREMDFEIPFSDDINYLYKIFAKDDFSIG